MLRIGVMGAAGGELDSSIVDVCRRLGAAIAKKGLCLLTGACPGLPQEVVIGAREHGAHIIGISPAQNAIEHVSRFESPIKEFDIIIYTGLGLMGRELINIRSSDFLLIVGGRSSTLGEFAIAYEEGKLIGVLEHTGGIASILPEIVNNLGKNTGAEIIYEKDPVALVDKLVRRHSERLSMDFD